MKKILLLSPLVFFCCISLSAQLEIMSCDTINFGEEGLCFVPEISEFKNSAISDVSCDNDSIFWDVYVDVWSDGVFEYEFSSAIDPNDNNILDDSNGNGVNDIYLAPTLSGEDVSILIDHYVEKSRYIHSIVWRATDSCGNEVLCYSGYKSIDEVLPVIDCVENITYGISDYCPDLNINDFLISVSDNCTVLENLVYSFIPDIEDIQTTYNVCEGDTTLTLHVIDESGNISSCDINLDFYQQPFMYSGKVFNTYDILISGADISVESDMWNSSQITDEKGEYVIYLSEDFDYSIQAIFNDNYKGISTRDLLLINTYLNDKASLSSPFDIIACDVNNDFTVDSEDSNYLRDLILEEREDTSLWKFLYGRIEFDDESNPFPYEEGIVHEAESDWHWKELLGIKLGDVDHSALAMAPDLDTLRLTANNVLVLEDEEIEVDFFLPPGTDVRGLQIALDHEMEFLGVQSGTLNITDEDTASRPTSLLITCIDGGVMTGDRAFTLIFKGKRCDELVNLIRVRSSQIGIVGKLPAEIYIDQELEVHALQLNVDGDLDYKTQIQFVPNPISEQSDVVFELNDNASLFLTAYDVSGRLIFEKDLGVFDKGKNGFSFIRRELVFLHSGLHLMRFKVDYENPELPDEIIVKKVILQE